MKIVDGMFSSFIAMLILVKKNTINHVITLGSLRDCTPMKLLQLKIERLRIKEVFVVAGYFLHTKKTFRRNSTRI